MLDNPGRTGWMSIPSQSVLLRSPSIDNGEYGTEELLLKTQVSDDIAQWSDTNNILQSMQSWQLLIVHMNIRTYNKVLVDSNALYSNLITKIFVTYKSLIFSKRITSRKKIISGKYILLFTNTFSINFTIVICPISRSKIPIDESPI